MSMDDTKFMGGAEFDDPSRIDNARPTSLANKVIGLSLILCLLSFVFYLWEAKFSDKDVLSPYVKGEKLKDPRWGWEPFKLEYQLYLDRGYDLEWMEGKTAREARAFLGDYASFFELFALRVFGLSLYFIYIVVAFLFFLSLGSVRYHDKKFEFKHISSTFNNAAIKVMFISLALSVVWCSLPFGMNLPVVNSVMPALMELPVFGVVWLSSPAMGAAIFGAIYSVAAYVIGANFSRDI